MSDNVLAGWSVLTEWPRLRLGHSVRTDRQLVHYPIRSVKFSYLSIQCSTMSMLINDSTVKIEALRLRFLPGTAKVKKRKSPTARRKSFTTKDPAVKELMYVPQRCASGVHLVITDTIGKGNSLVLTMNVYIQHKSVRSTLERFVICKLPTTNFDN